MTITTTFSEGRLELCLRGELDHHAAKEAMHKIGREIDVNLPRVCVMNLKVLTFMDSSGIAVILNTQKRMQEIGGDLSVTHVQSQPMKVLSASGICRIVTIAEAI